MKLKNIISSKNITASEEKSIMSFLKILIFIYGIIYGFSSYLMDLKYFLPCIAAELIYGVYLCVRKKPSLIISLIIFAGYAAAFIVYLINGEIKYWFIINPETSWIWLFSWMFEMLKPLIGVSVFGINTVIQVLIFCMTLKLHKYKINKRNDINE